MAEQAEDAERRRPRLSRERVVEAALAIADADGLGALTIRSLATELGVKPMSVYYHVASKDEILAALVDIVFGEIVLPVPGRDWRPEMERRADSAREVLARHRWAIGLLESRPDPGPANLRHHDTVIATLRAGGFSPEMTAHAYALIDSYVYGFALQEASLPFEGRESVRDIAGPIMERMAAGGYPHLAQMATTYYLQPGYDFGDEFRFGLDLILDGLEAAVSRQGAGPRGVS
jgi:AcrR family transcriptional regulator